MTVSILLYLQEVQVQPVDWHSFHLLKNQIRVIHPYRWSQSKAWSHHRTTYPDYLQIALWYALH